MLSLIKNLSTIENYIEVKNLMTKIKKLAGVFAICSSLGGLSAQVGAVGNPEFVFNADGKGGVLSIKTLDVNGVKAFENLELELDFTNSQFTLNNVSEADNTISEEPIETIEKDGFKVGLRGCSAESKIVTCHLLLTSVEFDRIIRFYNKSYSSGSQAFDNSGNQYYSAKVTIANNENSEYVRQRLVADVITEATIRFENLSTRATSFSLLALLFYTNDGNERADIEFRDISF